MLLTIRVTLLAVLLLVAQHVPNRDKGKKVTWNEPGVMSTSVVAKDGTSCFQTDSLMSADFFKGLQYEYVTSRRDSTDTFRKNGEAVRTFPEELQVTVSFFGVPCSGNSIPWISKSEVTDLARNIQLQAWWWKRCAEPGRAADLKEQPRLQALPIANAYMKNSFRWSYAFRIRASDIPLTDHLVILILDADKNLGRMTFDLVREFTWHFSVN